MELIMGSQIEAYNLCGSYAEYNVRGGYSRKKSLPFSTWPAVLLLATGTGGAVTTDNVTNIASWTPPFYEEHAHNEVLFQHEESTEIATSYKDQLDYIKRHSGLPVKTLSDAFDVSRPTFYNWLKDGEPKLELLPSIKRLAASVEAMNEIAPKNLGKLVLRPLFDGSSFLDLVFTNQDLTKPIQKLKVLAKKESSNRSIVKGNSLSTDPSRIFESIKPVSHS